MESINVPSKILLSIGSFTLVLLALVILASSPKDAIFSYACYRPQLMQGVKVEGNDLDATLEKASMGANKTMIIAMVNRAYVEAAEDFPTNMFDVFLESFWVGDETRPLIKNLLIVATDRTAYKRCLFRGLNCYLLADEMSSSDLAREKVFMSEGFINMMWRRTLFLLNVLQKGYDFIFTDTDVMWLRDPFPILRENIQTDIQISTDRFNGGTRSAPILINTGFYFVRSNNKTISLFERWYKMKDRSKGVKEQDVLQALINQGVLKELNINAHYLETRYFSGFCQISKDFDKVTTVHANCCRYISAKVKDLIQVLNDWNTYKGMPRNETSSLVWSGHKNCDMSWRRNNR